MIPGVYAFSYFFASVFFALLGLQSLPKNRPFLFILHALFGSLSFRRITDVTTQPAHASMIGMFFCVWIAHMSYVLCLSGSNQHPSIPDWDWHRAYKMCWNVRWVGTAHEAPSNTGKPRTATAPPNEKPSPGTQPPTKRPLFLLTRLLSILTIYTLNLLYEHTLLTLLPPFQPLDFAPSKHTFLRRLPTVSPRETTLRALLVLNFIWTSWAVISAYHHALSVFFVGVGLDAPHEWPTLYGSPWEMYSVRRFWGRFWHRSTFRTYMGYGNAVAGGMLGLRRGTVGHRLCVEFVVFLVSGVTHALTTRTLGYRAGYWEDVGWFCGNFVAILVETAFQALVRRVFGETGDRVRKGVGAVWLFLFFFWSLPKTQFPKVYHGVV
ncbi:MAG: hypothetical protein Q9195_005637 [Heterodermia aff. obscurata]